MNTARQLFNNNIVLLLVTRAVAFKTKSPWFRMKIDHDVIDTSPLAIKRMSSI